MKWFGEPYPSRDNPAPAYRPATEEVLTPIGDVCPYCRLAIIEGDNGFLLPYLSSGDRTHWAYHRRCLAESILGPEFMEHSDA